MFNLIEYNVFSKIENDKCEDFVDIYMFEDVFVKLFLFWKKFWFLGFVVEVIGFV